MNLNDSNDKIYVRMMDEDENDDEMIHYDCHNKLIGWWKHVQYHFLNHNMCCMMPMCVWCVWEKLATYWFLYRVHMCGAKERWNLVFTGKIWDSYKPKTATSSLFNLFLHLPLLSNPTVWTPHQLRQSFHPLSKQIVVLHHAQKKSVSDGDSHAI